MTVRCVGACGQAPVALIDGELVVRVESAAMVEQLERWEAQ